MVPRSSNTDCLVHIMSFLPTNEDMNSFAMCSKGCSEARNNESLDQLRIATIVCKQESTTNALFAKLNQASITLRKHPNYKHLKIVGLNALEADVVDYGMMIEPLAYVTTLELTKKLNSNEANRVPRTGRHHVSMLAQYFPHVEKLIADDVNIGMYSRFNALYRSLDKLTRVDWRQGLLNIDGTVFFAADNLTQLVLDGVCLICRDFFAFSEEESLKYEQALLLYSRNTRGSILCLLNGCEHLERLSLQNVTWRVDGTALPREPIPQEMLMKMVRCHPALRWLQSDLTPENVAILRQEHPEITFVAN